MARFDHVEVEAQLHQADFVVVRRMRADGERQAVAIDNRHDFHAFPALCRADFCSTTLRHHEGRVDEALLLIQHTFIYREVRWPHPSAPAVEPHCCTKFESADAQIYSSDSFAAACAIAHPC